jgi:DNA-binding response OmpR family regulator
MGSVVTIALPRTGVATRRILLIDDEPTLLATVRYNLEREGFEVVTSDRGDSGLDLASAGSFDLVILDVMLPGVDGFEVCRLLRKRSPVPILMLTAKTDEVDRVVGLELGADDYLTKPFSMRELLARVRAMLRRAEIVAAAQADVPADTKTFGDLAIDFRGQRILRNGVPLRLKPKELQLLLFLARHPGQVFTRDHLLERVWGYDFAGGTRTVDVHVRWLREKIEAVPAEPQRIQTVRGTGYRFEA